MNPKRVLILCTGNSCRSQMAEGWWNHLAGNTWQAFSAGSHPSGYVHPLAIEAMRNAGIDISTHRSQSVQEFADQHFDLVVTVCDHAREACPVWPNATKTLHWPFEDPARATGTDAEQRTSFHTIRDQIRDRIAAYLDPHA